MKRITRFNSSILTKNRSLISGNFTKAIKHGNYHSIKFKFMNTAFKYSCHPKYLLLLFIQIFFSSVKAQVTTFPYQENFDLGAGNWTATTIVGTAWELGVPMAAGTQGAYSTPNCWGTDLDSGYRAGSFAYLTSPKFYLTNVDHPYLSFEQFRYMSTGLDGMRLEYSTNDAIWYVLGNQGIIWGNNWYNTNSLFSTGLPAFTGNSGGWVKSGFNLDVFGNLDSIRFRFQFSSNTSFGSAQPGVFVDNFSIIDSAVSLNDIATVSLVSPVPVTTAGVPQDITVVLQNNSPYLIDSVSLGFSINGTNSPTQLFTVSIPPFQFDTITIGTITFTVPVNQLCVYASVNGDINNSNDTLCSTITTIQSLSIPYFEDFNLSDGNWYQTALDTLTKWEYGTPSFGTTNSAHSGVNCWDINLYTGYQAYATSYLYTPSFDLSTVGASILKFWINYRSENFWDGTRMEFSTDNGLTWNLLGYVGDPYSTNWYTNNSINSSSLPAWENTSPGWIQATYKLYQFIGQNNVRFRYVFTSDGSVNWDGVSIDDFLITELPAFDANLISVSTASTVYGLGAVSDPIKFTIVNSGSQTISNFIYQYSVNGILQNSATYTGVLNPNDTVIVSLPGFVVNQVSNIVCGEIVLVSDQDLSNNQKCTNVTGLTIYTPTYSDDFDSGNTGWYTQTIGDPATNWELGSPAYGATSSTLSPPTCWDINLNSAYQNNANCLLFTPLFDLTTAVHPKLFFWQNRNSEANFDGLRIEYLLSGSSTWNVLGSYGDPNATNWYTNTNLISSTLPGWDGNSNGWIKSTYDLDAIAATGVVQFKFIFSSEGAVITDGVSIDNFSLTTIYTNDASLVSFTSPGPSAIQGVSTPVEITLKNNGSLPITSLDIVYSLNNGTPVNYSWTGNLLTDSTEIVQLNPVFPIGGPNTLRAYINWSSDLYNYNDTITTQFNGIVTAGLPYSYDFESGSNGWIANAGPGNTRWELGMPNFGALNTTHSGTACWDINLSTPYFNLANAVLTSPIFDLSPYNIITIQFWENYSSESGADGMFLEYSNNGTTWQRLGIINDPQGMNWYNSNLTQSHVGWSGISGGWQSSSIVYYSPAGNSYLQLRFVFVSDFNLVDAGFSIDDINITGVTGNTEINAKDKIRLFPNPANDQIILASKNNFDIDDEILLYSSDGRNLPVNYSKNDNYIYINTQALNSGTYILCLKDGQGKNEYKRFTICH